VLEPISLDEPGRISWLFLRLFVLRVLFAVTAVLAYSKPVRIVSLVFHGCVIATFAIATSQREDDTVVFLGHGSYPFYSIKAALP
jgi:hypothetical protein